MRVSEPHTTRDKALSTVTALFVESNTTPTNACRCAGDVPRPLENLLTVLFKADVTVNGRQRCQHSWCTVRKTLNLWLCRFPTQTEQSADSSRSAFKIICIFYRALAVSIVTRDIDIGYFCLSVRPSVFHITASCLNERICRQSFFQPLIWPSFWFLSLPGVTKFQR